MNTRTRWIVVCLLLGVAGCRRSVESAHDQSAMFASYAELPALRATHDPALKAEYALLVAERATPELLDEDAARQQASEGLDLRILLSEQFNASALDYALQRTERMFDGPELKWDSISLVQASEFARQYEKQRLAIRESVPRPATYLSLPLAQGVGLNVELLDAALL